MASFLAPFQTASGLCQEKVPFGTPRTPETEKRACTHSNLLYPYLGRIESDPEPGSPTTGN
jgi:hypothetical protein